MYDWMMREQIFSEKAFGPHKFAQKVLTEQCCGGFVTTGSHKSATALRLVPGRLKTGFIYLLISEPVMHHTATLARSDDSVHVAVSETSHHMKEYGNTS